MRRHLLNIAAVFCLTTLGVLAWGYAARFGMMFYWPAGGGSIYVGHAFYLSLERGGVLLRSTRLGNEVRQGWPTIWRLHHMGQLWPLAQPDWRCVFWEFDAHWINIGNSSRTLVLSFPIWCAAIPFLIPPILWLRRRKRGMDRGFPVTDEAGGKVP